ncbi:replicative DNA helicase [Arthrobacter sp. UM1]|uniref:replicative DNA helicase n=1 Tax=Arthrobacter sp. UM1 TaxID=2766776 RepID=UPI001CF67A5C|nr:replicative DNA helicase [Arthrobacter sp. UM1]MCB4208592.1 replicative DNA helicase [Arthrobacter sp. UM1]
MAEYEGGSQAVRTPPQDIHAEESVLGGMLLSQDAIADVVETLRGNDFYLPKHEAIFDAIIDLYGHGMPADAVTVADQLQKMGELSKVGGAPYLHQLIQSVPTAANANFYAEIVRERSVLRKLAEAGTRIVQMGYSTDGEVEEIVNRAQAEVYQVAERRSSEDYVRLSEFMEGAVDEIEAAGSRGEEVSGVPTGFYDFDELTHGLHGGQMIVIAARPAVGKSTFALDFARSAAIKHNMTTVFFSLEMGRNEIAMRLLSAEASIPLQDLRKGTVDQDGWSKIAQTMGELDRAPLYVDDSPNMSLMEIRAKCRRLKQKHDLKLIVLDYLQLMSSGKRVESRQQEVSEFSRSLKLLAKELDVPLIALSQLNRGSEQRTDKKPMVSDLRESGCLTADARVLRADTGAETTMGELFASGAEDVPVWSLGEDGRFVERHLTHVFSTGVKPVYRLTLASGKSIRATANHPFYTYGGWTPLGELSAGDRLGVPRHVNGPSRRACWNDAEVILLAHMLGDGSDVRRQPIRYATQDELNVKAVTDAARHFGITAIRDEHPAARRITLRLPAPERLARGRRNPIAEWLDGLGLYGLRSWEKFIPDEVFALPKAQIALFLRHIWATDGSVTVSRNGRAGRVYFGSTSKQMLEGLSLLLLRFGISTRLRTASPKGEYRAGYTLDVSGRDEQLRFLREIGVHGMRGEQCQRLLDALESVVSNTNVDTVPVDVWQDVKEILQERKVTHRQFQASLGTQYCESALFKRAPSRQRMAKIATVLESAELEMLAVNDLLWDSVASIEYEGEEEVFDATVLGHHNFVANGITVHNSIEQDADMVILLHREDIYDKESPRAGEADVIVAKHRNGPTKTITVAFQGHYSRFNNMSPAVDSGGF